VSPTTSQVKTSEKFANKTSEAIYLSNKPKPLKKLDSKSLVDISKTTLSLHENKPMLPKKRSISSKKSLEKSVSTTNLFNSNKFTSSESENLSREPSHETERKNSSDENSDHSKEDSGHGGSSESADETPSIKVDKEKIQKPKPGGSGMMKWKCTHTKNVRISNTDRTIPVQI